MQNFKFIQLEKWDVLALLNLPHQPVAYVRVGASVCLPVHLSIFEQND
jgi:hypothetical protein